MKKLFTLLMIMSVTSLSFAISDSESKNDETSSEPIAIYAKDMIQHSKWLIPETVEFSGMTDLKTPAGHGKWSLTVPKSGEYYVHALYASTRACPVRFSFVGRPETVCKNVLGQITGGDQDDALIYETLGPFSLAAGNHQIKLSPFNGMPHLMGFLISTKKELPEVTRDPFLAPLAKKRQQDRISGQARLKKTLLDWKKNEEELADLDELIEKADQLDANDPKFDEKYQELCHHAGREYLLSRDVREILFVKRRTIRPSHYYTDFIDGIYLFGTELCVLDLKTGKVRSLVPSLAEGLINRCALSPDGKKVVFDYKRRIGEGFRIWEVGVDGSGLRQITLPPKDEEARIKRYRHIWDPIYDHLPGKLYWHHSDDMHPCWLPDGGIAFVSTRCELSILCDGGDLLTTSVLYRVNADGSHLEKLSNNALSEAAPSVTSDGRILYTRWEYVDNGSVTNKGLWVVRPDGTGSEELYGANIAWPPVFYAGREVPGSSNLFVCIGTPHQPAAIGTIILVDPRKDRRTGAPMKYITPEVECRHLWGWDHFSDQVKPIQAPYTLKIPFHFDKQWDKKGSTIHGPLFADPCPIDEDLFITPYNASLPWSTPDAYQLAIINAEGMRLPFYKAEGTSCWNPIVITQRDQPPVVRGVVDPELAKKGLARVSVSDVYQGLDGVARGSIKYIRINEHVGRPWNVRPEGPDSPIWNQLPNQYDQQYSVITKDTHLGLKVQHGIVPVEEDGSAHFLVRADKNIFLQVLDSEYREVQRERTFINYRPGEVRSCIGCHETAANTLAVRDRHFPTALSKPPVVPGPQPGETSGARVLHYPSDIQPILDRSCVQCHSESNPAGSLVLTGEMTKFFSRSYEELMDHKLFPVIRENHPKSGNNHYLPPYSLGSHASNLAKRIFDPKSPCYLPSREDRIRFTTWIDSNGQYYGSYYGNKNLIFKGKPGFRPVPSFEETQTSVPPDYSSAQ